MTRKIPSRTKRELDKLRRRRNDDGEDTPAEVVVELGGVPARGPEEGSPRPTAGGEAFEAFRVGLDSGEVETETPDLDNLSACPKDSCQNPALPSLGTCEKCAGMPRRDWRPVVRENEADGGNDG